jgi:hypothetical protein
MNQQELAALLGTHQEAVTRMEGTRYRSVGLERLVRVSEVLGLSLSVVRTVQTDSR